MTRCAILLMIAASVTSQEDADRAARERAHDSVQRVIQLQLFDVNFKNTPLNDVLDFIASRGFKVSRFDARGGWVTYKAKGVTLRQLLDVIEDQVDLNIFTRSDRVHVYHKKVRKNPRAYVPGLTVELQRRVVRSGMEVRGVALYACSLGPAMPMDVELRVFDADNLEVPVERCDRCGPLLVFVKGDPGPLTLRLKGQAQWNSVYVLEVSDPGIAQEFRVAGYTVRYEFPVATVTSEVEIPFEEFPSVRLLAAFKDKRKTPQENGMAFGCGTIARVGWCDCTRDGPLLKMRRPATRRTGQSHFFMMQAKATDLSSMTIRFQKPIREPFEVELKTLNSHPSILDR